MTIESERAKRETSRLRLRLTSRSKLGLGWGLTLELRMGSIFCTYKEDGRLTSDQGENSTQQRLTARALRSLLPLLLSLLSLRSALQARGRPAAQSAHALRSKPRAGRHRRGRARTIIIIPARVSLAFISLFLCRVARTGSSAGGGRRGSGAVDFGTLVGD